MPSGWECSAGLLAKPTRSTSVSRGGGRPAPVANASTARLPAGAMPSKICTMPQLHFWGLLLTRMFCALLISEESSLDLPHPGRYWRRMGMAAQRASGLLSCFPVPEQRIETCMLAEQMSPGAGVTGRAAAGG